MAVTMTLGQTLPLSLAFLDQNGGPMATPTAPDSPPIWTSTSAALETLVVAPDGLTAVATSVAPGTDTISVSVTVGGSTFTASLVVTVPTPAQVLTSVAIVAGTPAP